MIQEVVSFKTTDGKTFDNAVDAAAHQKYLEKQARIEAYIAQSGFVKAQAGLARKIISGWMAFEEQPEAVTE